MPKHIEPLHSISSVCVEQHAFDQFPTNERKRKEKSSFAIKKGSTMVAYQNHLHQGCV